MKKKGGNHTQKKITLAGLLANTATGKSRLLLKRHGKEDAVNHEDLEHKISMLYAETSDKKALEKELAEIHPHKELILKYCAPKPELQDDSKKSDNVVVVEAPAQTPIIEEKSNCSGCSMKSNCSGFEGETPSQSAKTSDSTVSGINTQNTIIAVIAIIALVSIIKISK